MAEYNERKAAINRIKEYALDVYGIDLDDAKQFGGYSRVENYCEGLYEATELIDDMPAADVAPVVRCKDCKHSYITVDARCCSYGAFYDVAVPDDFFCALAERKDGDDNAAD